MKYHPGRFEFPPRSQNYGLQPIHCQKLNTANIIAFSGYLKQKYKTSTWDGNIWRGRWKQLEPGLKALAVLANAAYALVPEAFETFRSLRFMVFDNEPLHFKYIFPSMKRLSVKLYAVMRSSFGIVALDGSSEGLYPFIHSLVACMP